MSIIHRVFTHRIVYVVLLVLAQSARSFAEEGVTIPASVSSIQIASYLQPSVDDMLRTSPTFRSLYSRVAATPSVIVSMRADPFLLDCTFHARSAIRRYKSGLLVVEVFVRPGRDQAEWIAHEFAHVVEQLDGLDLPALAERRASGVWYSGAQVLETSRAVRAGRIVAEEMRGPMRSSDKLVQ